MRKYEVTINDKPFKINILELSAEQAELEVNGKAYTVSIDRISQAQSPGSDKPPVRSASSSAPVAPACAQGAGGAGSVLAPIPGSIMDIYVKLGDKVEAGQPLFKMEAMKMENEINARAAGTVQAINICVGDAVNQGQELMLVADD